MGKPTRKPRQARNRKAKSAQPRRPRRTSEPSFELEALEPRILLSGTWVGTEGDDSYNAGNHGEELHGLGGHDTLHGGTGADIVDGGTGNDHLYGDQGSDVLISGGGNDIMEGAQGNDTFQFTGAQHGDVITVVGGNSNDTLDLSTYNNAQVHESGSTITVDLGGGQSFTINHSEIETIQTAQGTYAPGGVPVNHAPVASNGSVHVNEDGSAGIHLSGTDPDAGDAVDHYVIDSLPDHGSLLLNGHAVHSGDSVSQADVDAGHLTFNPEANWNGDTSFGFHAHDGDALSANAGTFTIHVDPVNDAPLASDGSVHINEDASTAIHLAGSDPDAGDAVDHYVIDALPDHGSLLLNGHAVHSGDSVSQADVDAGHLTFNLEANWNGDTSFGFHAHDGDALSANAGTFTIHVDAVDDAPTAHAGATQTVDESTPVTLDSTISSDVDSGSLTHTWTQIDGPAVQLSDAGTAHPTFMAPDVSAPTTLHFQVDVSDGQLHSTDTVAVTVNPVAPPPPPVSVDPQPVSPPVVELPPPVAPPSDPVVDVNHGPIADAGHDLSVYGLDQVRLNATGSRDLDGDALFHTWTQVDGPAVQLSDAHAAQPVFSSPDVSEPTHLTFQLAVNDGRSTVTDTVTVTVNPLDHQVDPTPDPVGPSPHVDPTPVAPPTSPVDHAPTPPSAPGSIHPVEAPNQPAAPVQHGSGEPHHADARPEVHQPSTDPNVQVIAPDAATGHAGRASGPAPVAGFVHSDAGTAPSNHVSTPPVGTDGDHAENVVETVHVAPTSQAGEHHGQGNPKWNDVENIGMLDPMEHLSGSVEVARAEAHASPQPEGGAGEVPAGVEHEFRATEVFTLPAFAMTSMLAAGLVPAAPDRLTADEAYQEVTGAADLANARRWRSRFGEESPFEGPPSIESGAQRAGARSEAPDAAHDDGEASGFFARLWGAVRGIGATTKPSDEREDANQRGVKRG